MSEHTARRWVPVLALATALATTSCSQDTPLEQPGPEVPGGDPMADERVSEDVKVTAVELPYPPDGLWEAGSDVEVHMTISNTGTTDARLVDVRGEGFADVRDADGGDVEITVPAGEAVVLSEAGPPELTLVDLAQDMRSSQAVLLTLEFADAGTIDIEATVSPEEPAPEEDPVVPESGAGTTGSDQ